MSASCETHQISPLDLSKVVTLLSLLCTWDPVSQWVSCSHTHTHISESSQQLSQGAACTHSLARSLTRTERYRLRLPKHRQVPGFSRESPLFLAGLGSPTVFHCNCYDVRVSVHPNGLLKTTTRIDWFHSLLVVHGERHAGLLQTSNPARSSTEKVRWFFSLLHLKIWYRPGVWHNYQISSNELQRCTVICSKATLLCILFQSQCLSVLLGGNIL